MAHHDFSPTHYHTTMGWHDAVLELAQPAVADDPHGYRTEFVEMVRRATEVAGG